MKKNRSCSIFNDKKQYSQDRSRKRNRTYAQLKSTHYKCRDYILKYLDKPHNTHYIPEDFTSKILEKLKSLIKEDSHKKYQKAIRILCFLATHTPNQDVEETYKSATKEDLIKEFIEKNFPNHAFLVTKSNVIDKTLVSALEGRHTVFSYLSTKQSNSNTTQTNTPEVTTHDLKTIIKDLTRKKRYRLRDNTTANQYFRSKLLSTYWRSKIQHKKSISKSN